MTSIGSSHRVRTMPVILALALLLGLCPQAGADLATVWAVDDGEKILRYDTSHPLEAGGGDNSVWDGSTVRLFAARNEIAAFQLILEADDAGATDVAVVVSDLTNGEVTIRGSHPLPAPNDYVGVGVELFTEHYLHVTEPSYNDPDWGGFYTTYEANPQITGWIPDGLIPFSAAAGKGGAPFDIPASSNQGVWVDIYVDNDVPSGTYAGSIQVSVGGEPAATLPIELEILALTLPDENHYHSMVFYSDSNIRSRHDLTWGSPELWEMLLDYHRMAHRHRLELIGSGSWDELTALEGTLTGDAFTPSNGYEGPGEGVGNTLFSIHTYGWSFGDTEAEYRTNSDTWVTWFDANAPDVEYFLYLIDEPGSDMYAWITERAGWIHNNPGPGNRLPVFVTKWPVPQLVGAVDIWSMQAPWWDPAEIAAAEARGERAWLYAGNRPQTPMDVMDEYGVALRLKPWIARKCGVPRWFTWETTHWYPNTNEVPNDVPKNVFVDPVTFYAGYAGSRGNGDGTMFYPGEDAVFPDQNRDYPGPLSSIRMKMYRRGVQDYEYMWLAEQAGHGEEVGWILERVLPDVMWEAPEVPNWSNSNAVYEEARRDLADLMGPARAPKAGFSASATYGSAPLAVTFTDQTLFEATSWQWDFGDGSTSSDRNPSHTYANTGAFTVALTATNAQGADTETRVDCITTIPPTTEATDTSDTWGTWHGWAEVTVTSGDLGSLSADDDVYMVAECNGENQRYSMWYTCDTALAPAQVAKMTIEYQAHSSGPDTPDCLLFVRQSDGSFEYITTRLWSTADEWFTWETTNLAKYMSPDGVVGFEVCGCPQNSSNYTISVDVLRFRFEVFDPPTAAFSGSPTSGTAPLTAQFSDESMYPMAWSWNFGDGRSSAARHPGHIYRNPGIYTVSLTAMNGGGQDTDVKPDYVTASDSGAGPLPLLEVHPNERAQSATGGPSMGAAPWVPASLAAGPWYKWKKYVFDGGSELWIQVCAQCFDLRQTGAAESDKLQMRVDGLVPADYWGLQSGPSGTAFDYQWRGGVDRGDKVTLEFLVTGLTPGSHLIDFRADGTPTIWWVKVVDLQLG